MPGIDDLEDFKKQIAAKLAANSKTVVASTPSNYWQPGSSVWEHWRKHHNLSKEEAMDRWFWKPWKKRWGF